MSPWDDQLLRRLGETAAEVFFIYDISAEQLTYISPAFDGLSVIPMERVMNHPQQLWDVVHEEDRVYLQEQLTAFVGQKQIRAEFRILKTDSTIVYVQLTAYQLIDREQLAVGWVADVNTLKNNTLYAERINARKNSLLEILSHDLKEPVAMINMMATAIGNNPAVAGNKTLEGYIRVIQELCESNIRLIRSLVQQEFLEATEIGLRMERADLVWAIRDIMQLYQASEAVINKTFSFYSDAPQVYILMDTLKIIQVINNLVSNAIKFTADGGEIKVHVEDLGTSARISVSDNGIGIPAQLQPYLFEPRTKAQRSGVRGETGSGMGLFIIRSLVELHGGSVWLESDEAIGTVFYIDIPKQT